MTRSASPSDPASRSGCQAFIPASSCISNILFIGIQDKNNKLEDVFNILVGGRDCAEMERDSYNIEYIPKHSFSSSYSFIHSFIHSFFLSHPKRTLKLVFILVVIQDRTLAFVLFKGTLGVPLKDPPPPISKCLLYCF